MIDLNTLVGILPDMVGFAIAIWVLNRQIADLKEIVYILFDRLLPDDEDSVEIVNFERMRDHMLAIEAKRQRNWDESKDL